MSERISKTEARGYSIWLMPDPEVAVKIEESIEDLGNWFASPVFPPHLTLLGQIIDPIDVVLPKFRQLGSTAEALTLSPIHIGIQDNFFRSIYYEMKLSAELEQLNNNARVSFNRESDEVFFPHLSLHYGFIENSEKQKAILALQLQRPAEFDIASIVLMKTEGSVEKWELIEQIELK